MFLRKLFKKKNKYTELKEKPKKDCHMCERKFSKINYAVKKKNKVYIFCCENCYYNWLRDKAGLEPY